MARPTSIWVCHYFGHDIQCRTTMIDYVDEIVAAYDKAWVNLRFQCFQEEELSSKDKRSSR